MILNYVVIVFIIIFLSDESYGKKRINIDGVYYECKSPKNSFERTRGVRNRICICLVVKIKMKLIKEIKIKI